MKYITNLWIETDRLIIRPYIDTDFDQCFQLMQDPELFDYLDMDIMSKDEYKDLFNWLISCYTVPYDKDFKYSFNILLKETGNHIGWCGVGGVEFNHEMKEIYYLIGKNHWGNGYAKEAATALLDYAFNIMNLDELVGLCKPENYKSKNILESIGMKFKYNVSGLTDDFDYYNDEPFYSISKDDYFKR